MSADIKDSLDQTPGEKKENMWVLRTNEMGDSRHHHICRILMFVSSLVFLRTSWNPCLHQSPWRSLGHCSGSFSTPQACPLESFHCLARAFSTLTPSLRILPLQLLLPVSDTRHDHIVPAQRRLPVTLSLLLWVSRSFLYLKESGAGCFRLACPTWAKELPIVLQWTQKKVEYPVRLASVGMTVDGFGKYVGMGLVQRSIQEMLGSKEEAHSKQFAPLVLEMRTFFVAEKKSRASGQLAHFQHMLHDAVVGSPEYSHFVTWLDIANRTWTIDKVFLNDILPAGRQFWDSGSNTVLSSKTEQAVLSRDCFLCLGRGAGGCSSPRGS